MGSALYITTPTEEQTQCTTASYNLLPEGAPFQLINGKQGVVEYRIVRPAEAYVEVDHNQGKQMQLVQTAREGDTLASKALEGFVLDLSQVFGDVSFAWNRKIQLNSICDSSTGFCLPYKSIKSPDLAFLLIERIDSLSEKERNRFATIQAQCRPRKSFQQSNSVPFSPHHPFYIHSKLLYNISRFLYLQFHLSIFVAVNMRPNLFLLA